jgi:hypothetical protein
MTRHVSSLAVSLVMLALLIAFAIPAAMEAAAAIQSVSDTLAAAVEVAR